MLKSLGRRKLITDISASTVQTGVTQVAGLIVFYFTSRFLDKGAFGELNWCMAVCATMLAIGSLGLDLIYVKRVAAGSDVIQLSGIHFFHTVISGGTLVVISFAVTWLAPSFGAAHPVFILVLMNLAISNVANSFRLCLNGLERYRRLAALALVTSTAKIALMAGLYLAGMFSLHWLVIAFIVSSVIEFISAYVMAGNAISHYTRPVLRVEEYKYFILESLPQLGVVLFDSALARIDWILLGVMSTAVVTAEYSFAYKLFELSKVPLIIISPVLLTRFAKLSSGHLDDGRAANLRLFFRAEMFVIVLIPLALATLWAPLMDLVTENKYGTVNTMTYWLLALCVPLHAMVNFLWTIGFVKGQLKTILAVTIAVSLLNIAGNLALIPFFGALGAAVVFVACTLVQLALYARYVKSEGFGGDTAGGFLFIVAGVVCGGGSIWLLGMGWSACVIALVAYVAVCVGFGMVRPRDIVQQFRATSAS